MTTRSFGWAWLRCSAGARICGWGGWPRAVAGASGYLLKDTTGQDLAVAILRVAAGASLLDPAVTGVVLSRLKADRDPSQDALTDRERQILELIAQGKTNREIGEVLYLAEGTGRNLVSGIPGTRGGSSRVPDGPAIS